MTNKELQKDHDRLAETKAADLDEKLDAAIAQAETLRNALQVASDRLHLICGTYMAIPHGDPESRFWDAIKTMGPDMDVVTTALAPISTEARKEGESCAHGKPITGICEKCARFLHFHKDSSSTEGRAGCELEPFDLQRALAGEKVVTRDGRSVVGLKLVGIALHGFIGNQRKTWTKLGRWYIGDTDSTNDLFMAPAPQEGGV